MVMYTALSHTVLLPVLMNDHYKTQRRATFSVFIFITMLRMRWSGSFKI